MNAKRLRLLARRHAAGHPPRPCSHDETATPCDAALLAAEVARIRTWADFASDLLDAHIWGFSPGDWHAAEGLAIALWGSDWPPDWKRDHDNPARIIVDPSVWPARGLPDIEPGPARSSRAHILTADAGIGRHYHSTDWTPLAIWTIWTDESSRSRPMG